MSTTSLESCVVVPMVKTGGGNGGGGGSGSGGGIDPGHGGFGAQSGGPAALMGPSGSMIATGTHVMGPASMMGQLHMGDVVSNMALGYGSLSGGGGGGGGGSGPLSPPMPSASIKYGTLVPNRIFVGGISASTTESDLHKLFSAFGNVKSTKIISDRGGCSKGYGFVTFETEEEAKKLQLEVTHINSKHSKN